MTEKEERTCMYCWRPICCCDSCMSDGSWGEAALGCIIDGGMWCAGCCWYGGTDALRTASSVCVREKDESSDTSRESEQ